MAFRTITLPLLVLLAVLHPSLASENRAMPDNVLGYGKPSVPRYGRPSLGFERYRPGKSMSHSYYDQDESYPSSYSESYSYSPSSYSYSPSSYSYSYSPSSDLGSYSYSPSSDSDSDSYSYSPSSYSNSDSYSYSPSSSLVDLFLLGQNAARLAVGLPPLRWDDTLASYAQNWANQRVNDCSLTHSNGPYGENIFWGSGDSDWSAKQAVNSWVVEKQYYDHNSNSCSGGQDCGHYTQIIWKSTTKVGCAKVTCNGGKGVFVTCNYDPPGNYMGQRPY